MRILYGIVFLLSISCLGQYVTTPTATQLYWNNVSGITSPPDIGSWTWVNQNGAIVTGSQRGLYMSANAISGTHSIRAMVQTAPATPYEYGATVGILNPSTNTWDAITGIIARDSASGKLLTCQLENDNGSGGFGNFQFTSATYWSSPTAPVQDQVIDYYRIVGSSVQPVLKYGDDGINRYCSVSMDGGLNWIKYVNQARTTNLTADQIGWFADVYEGSMTSAWAATLLSWQRTI